MIREKLQSVVGEKGNVADWFIFVKYLDINKEYRYNGKNIGKIIESQVKDYQIVHKSVIFPPKAKKEEIKMTEVKMTKEQIRKALEAKGVTLSNNEFKKTKLAELQKQLDTAAAKQNTSGISAVINQLKEIVKAGGVIADNMHKIYRKLANNEAAAKNGLVADEGQYVIGAKVEKGPLMFLIDSIGVLRVYKAKKVLWRRMKVNRVGDAVLYYHNFNGREEGRVVSAAGTVKFEWVRKDGKTGYDLPAVRTEEGKPVSASIRVEEQERVRDIIEQVYPSKKEVAVVSVPSTLAPEEDVPFDINA